jgi:hypothetical protein
MGRPWNDGIEILGVPAEDVLKGTCRKDCKWNSWVSSSFWLDHKSPLNKALETTGNRASCLDVADEDHPSWHILAYLPQLFQRNPGHSSLERSVFCAFPNLV